MRYLIFLASLMLIASVTSAVDALESDGWKTESPKQGLLPHFAFQPAGGPDGKGGLVIESAEKSGLPGHWHKTLASTGGRWYRFRAFYKTRDVADPTRSAAAKVTWVDANGNAAPIGPERVANEEDFHVEGDVARALYPPDVRTDEKGWTEISATYQAPEKATGALIELQLRWAPGGRIEWGGVTLSEVEAPKPRKARFAAVHFAAPGKTPDEIRRQFEPFIKQAADQKADLVVLGEHITLMCMNYDYGKAAEPIPGPSTEYFAALAKQYNLYIVVGLIEKDGQDIYNTAALLGPEGKLVGKYRKTCIPRGEIEGGVIPGTEYPVFQTRFGKVGMMICWDVHFPEVARNLTNNGAEVIAMPIAGGMPLLAAARAMENQIFLVSSTYTDHNADWIKTGVWSPAGKLLCQAKEWGSVVVTEVDLDEPVQWLQIGDFRGRIPREKPAGFQTPGKK